MKRDDGFWVCNFRDYRIPDEFQHFIDDFLKNHPDFCEKHDWPLRIDNRSVEIFRARTKKGKKPSFKSLGDIHGISSTRTAQLYQKALERFVLFLKWEGILKDDSGSRSKEYNEQQRRGLASHFC